MKKNVVIPCQSRELSKQEDYPKTVYLQDRNIPGYFIKRRVKDKTDRSGTKYAVSKTVVFDNRDGSTTGVINESTRHDGFRHVFLNLIDGKRLMTLIEIAQARDILPYDLEKIETGFYKL